MTEQARLAETAEVARTGPEPSRTAERAASTSGPRIGLSAAALLDLQRSAGNRAVAALIDTTPAKRGQPDPGALPTISAPSPSVPMQRVLNPDQEQAWKSADGDRIVAAIEGIVSSWKRFRGNPAFFEQISGIGSPRPLVTLLEQNPQFRQHVAEKLRASVVYLQEMAGFLHVWRLLLDLIPGLSWKDPKHQYKMTASASATINQIGYLPVQQWTVAYSNAYGWSWSRDIVTAGIQWSIGVSAQAGVPGPNISDIAGGKKKVAGKLKPGTSVSYPGKPGPPGPSGEPGAPANPLMPSFASFSVTHFAMAKPVKYWGFNDLGGVAGIVNGPSESIKLGPAGGVAVATGGMLKLHSSNGDLDFTEFKADIKNSLGKEPGSLKEAANYEAKMTLAAVGAVAVSTVGEASGVTAPEVKKVAKEETRTFVYTLEAFPVESPEREIPSGMTDSIGSDISQLEDRVLEDDAGLRELGIEQDFKVTFTCEGFASRGWSSAANDAMRKQKNVELSAKRAQFVSAALEALFGNVGESFSAIGRGAALLAPESERGPRAGDVVAEDDTVGINRLVERYRLKWLDDTMRWEASTGGEKTPPDTLLVRSYEEALRFRESLMKSNPETSTAPGAQRVNITITWKGHLLEYGTEAAGAAPTPAPAP